MTAGRPPPELHERVSRIEEKMAMRDEVAALRLLIETRNATLRRVGRALFGAAIAIGFLVLLLIVTR
ncbi:MAG: hypothetical protein OXO52_03280 [Rhodospirillales bacterium]|nr:hypothetical protein [Rhodospirillales bacterium]